MELYVSGVPVPKLGSLLDVTSRQYLVKRAGKEIHLNKLVAHIALASNQSGNKEWSDKITSIWNGYVNEACYMEDEIELRDTAMKVEFEHWKKIKPVLFKDDTGRVMVKGITLPKAN